MEEDEKGGGREGGNCKGGREKGWREEGMEIGREKVRGVGVRGLQGWKKGRRDGSGEGEGYEGVEGARVEERRELNRRYFFSLPELYLPFEERVLAGSRLCRSLRWCFCFLAHL